jgi:hypothetical protein
MVSDRGGMTLTAGRNLIPGAQAGLYSASGAVAIDAEQSLHSPTILTAGRIDLLSRNGTLHQTGQIRGGSAPVSLRAGGDLHVTQPIVLGDGGNLTVAAGGALTVNAVVRGGSDSRLVLGADGEVSLNRDIAVRSGHVGVSAGGQLRFGNSIGIFAGIGDILLQSGSHLVPGYLQAGGGVVLHSAGDLIINQAIGGDVGRLEMKAAGDLRILSPIVDLSYGLIAEAGNSLYVDHLLFGIGGDLILSAGNTVFLNADVVSANAPLTVLAGGTLLQASDGVDAYGAPLTRQLRAGNAPLSVRTGGDLDLGSLVTQGSLSVVSTGGDININVPIYETTGNTHLDAAGDIQVNQVIANATSGADLLMQAGGDIVVNARIGPWDRSDATYPTIDRDALPGGRIQLLAVGDILINQAIGSYRGGLAHADAGAIEIGSSGGSVLLTPGIRVSSDGGAIGVRSYADLNNGPAITVLDAVHLNATPDTGYFTTGALSLASTGGDVHVNQWIPNTTGSVTINAADRLEINQRIYTHHGDISLFAGAGGIWQNPLADPEPVGELSTLSVSDVDSGNGNLYLEAVGDIQPHILRSAGNLTIKSTAGAILGGRIEVSRDSTVSPTVYLSTPDRVELAGYSGINGFNTNGSGNVAAISANGSIINLGVFLPGSLLMIAAEDIVTPTSVLGSAPRLYAGRDIVLKDLFAGNFTAHAGRDLQLTLHGFPGIVNTLDLSSGFAPFDTLTGVTIAGVAPPVWGGPFGAGDITVTAAVPANTLWVEGNGGFSARATGDITLPEVHVSYSLDVIPTHWDATLAQQQIQPFNLTAGGNITLDRLQSVGPVSMVSSGGDIRINFTLGAHVSTDPVIDPAAAYWNPDDLGLASLILRADSGDIRMHEARAEGNIAITAPNGTFSFLGVFDGIEAGGTRLVSDSGGAVTVGDFIDPTPVARIPRPSFVAPGVAPGPTLAGPSAAAQPGALPPGAPAAPLVSAGSPAAVPGGPNAPGGSVAGNGPAGVSVGATQLASADGGDGFGEIFVADDAAEQPVERQRDSQTAAREESGASDESAEPSSDAASEPASAAVMVAEQDDEEQRKRKAAQRQAESYLVFAGGRGDARERDFGRSEPVEYNRVRP